MFFAPFFFQCLSLKKRPVFSLASLVLFLSAAFFLLGVNKINAEEMTNPSSTDPLPETSLPHSTLPCVTLGNQAAPLKITMFHSLNCIHCKEFKDNVLPQIKQEFIDKGLVHFTLVDFPTDPSALDAAKIAWEGRNAEEYEKVSHLLTSQYETWAGQADWPKHLCQIMVKNNAMTEIQCEQALADEALGKEILRNSYEVQRKYKIDYAPAFLFNGELKKTDELLSIEDVRAEVEKLTSLKVDAALLPPSDKVMILK